MSVSLFHNKHLKNVFGKVRKPVTKAKASELESGLKPGIRARVRQPILKQGWSRLGRTGARLGTRQDPVWSKARSRSGIWVEQPVISCCWWV